MTPLRWLAVCVASLAGSALFAALFLALRDLARTTLEEIVVTRRRPSATRRIERILADLDGHAAAVALPRIVLTVLAVVATIFATSGFAGSPSPGWVETLIGAGVAALLIWLFSVAIPLGVSRHAGEQLVYSWSWLVRACYVLLRPLIGVVRFMDELIRRLAGRTASSPEEDREAELLSVVEEGRLEGQFDEVERDMIEAIVEFRDTTVEQIMTPRTEVEALEMTDDLGALTRFIRRCKHSRFPVYRDNLDHIAGMFYVKDLVRWLAGEGRNEGRPFSLESILRPALFVPETKTIRELLAELLEKRVHVAMVADEYGGTSGLVTIEDIIEEVFGEIRDEYEDDEEDTPPARVITGSRAAEIDARASIADVNSTLRAIAIELPEGEEYDTVGGLVVTRLGRIPAAGESLRVGPAVLTVLDAEPSRVTRVRVDALDPAASPATHSDVDAD